MHTINNRDYIRCRNSNKDNYRLVQYVVDDIFGSYQGGFVSASLYFETHQAAQLHRDRRLDMGMPNYQTIMPTDTFVTSHIKVTDEIKGHGEGIS